MHAPPPRSDDAAGSDSDRLLDQDAAECRRLLDDAPRDVDLLVRLSDIEGRLGHAAEATRCIEKALVYRPDSLDAWHRYGEMLLVQKRYADAIHALRRAVALGGRSAELCRSLGTALGCCGKVAEAVEAYRQALSLKPDSPELWSTLGGMLARRGDPAEAAVCFEKAVLADPTYAAGFNNLGILRMDLGRLEEAATLFHKAISLRADFSEAYNNLGTILSRQGKHEESAVCFGQALAIRPNYPEALVNLGMAHSECGKRTEAADAFRRALSLKPDFPEALDNLAMVLADEGRVGEAMVCLDRALEINPADTTALSLTAGIRFKEGRLDEAAALYSKVITLRPDLPEGYNNLGMVLGQQDEFDRSIANFGRALALHPDHPDVLMNLGNSLRDAGRLPEAISALERAVSLREGFPGFHLNLGIFLLAAGRMDEGWREYEWRWKCAELASERRTFTQPRWTGEAASGSRLLLHSEQGFGDTIQFCRYAPLAAARGLRVVLAVQPPLVRLLRSLDGVETVIGTGDALPEFDLHCPLLSLPLAFGTRLESIPADIPYLAPGEDAVLAWRQRLPKNPASRLKVGLVCAGTSRKYSPVVAAADRRRSIAPEMLAPLLEVEGVQFYNLQKDGPPLPAEWDWVDLMDTCRDFADTAALIANLDLVISVDTAVAHLAGALGKPVWLLTRFSCCWRWLRTARTARGIRRCGSFASRAPVTGKM